MEIIIKKEIDESIEMKLKFNNQDEKNFDYIDFIEGVYNQEEIENIKFDENINDWEKEAIIKLINKINELINNKVD